MSKEKKFHHLFNRTNLHMHAHTHKQTTHIIIIDNLITLLCLVHARYVLIANNYGCDIPGH